MRPFDELRFAERILKEFQQLFLCNSLQRRAHADGHQFDKAHRCAGIPGDSRQFQQLIFPSCRRHTVHLYAKLPIGIRFRCGDAVLRMTQIGKECHADCEIRRLTGDCIMPREGVFAVVEQGGTIRPGDAFGILPTVAVVTVSDSGAAGKREDKAGPVIVEEMQKLGYLVGETHLVSDDREGLAKLLAEIADEGRAQLVLTTGGTGFSPRDNTPEATMDIAEKSVPGIPEAMRAYSMRITPRGMLSRGTAAIRKRTLIINLPGSPKAVRENLEAVTPALTHGIEILTGAAANCAAPEQ